MKSVAKPIPTADEINEAHRMAKSSAEDAVGHAIRCGAMLIAVRDGGEHGEFRKWIERNTEIAHSTATRYMKAARQNATAVAFSSLRGLFPSGQKPETKAAKPESQPFEVPAKPVEVAPAPEFDPDGYEPEDDEAYQSNVENVMMADDKLGAMREELKRVHRELAAVKASRDHYQSEAGAAVRLVKARDRDIEKLRKQLAKAQAENEALRERAAIVEAA